MIIIIAKEGTEFTVIIDSFPEILLCLCGLKFKYTLEITHFKYEECKLTEALELRGWPRAQISIIYVHASEIAIFNIFPCIVKWFYPLDSVQVVTHEPENVPHGTFSVLGLIFNYIIKISPDKVVSMCYYV